MRPGSGEILVVDDEPPICSLIKDSLAGEGMRCITAAGGEQAMRVLSGRGVSILISDIAMPDVTGLDLLTYCHRRRLDCRVILMSGLCDVSHIADAIRLGAFDYLHKPLDFAQLFDTVRKASSGDARHMLPLRAAQAMRHDTDVRQASLESIRALARAVEAKDPYTRRHSEQVEHYATRLAIFMDVSQEELQRLSTAALLHDIGKIGVPDHILTKPGSLTDEEFAWIRKHPDLGADILSNISLFQQEAMLVRHHHENWDGSGYPDALAGEAIPVGARIINIADSMDAMLMKRTYKEAYSVEMMLGEIARCSGRQFDPRLAQTALDWCDKFPEQLILANGPAGMADPIGSLAHLGQSSIGEPL